MSKVTKDQLVSQIEDIALEGTKKGVWRMNPLGGFKGYKYRKKENLVMLRDNLLSQFNKDKPKIRIVEANELDIVGS